MKEELNLIEAMEWYALAGITETCGNEPFRVEKEDEKKLMVSKLQTHPNVNPRLASAAHLADDSLAAVRNARDICENSNTFEELEKGLERFDGCALKLTAKHTVFGDGNRQAKIVFVGEAPGADEDRIGKPFVGRSGQLLDRMLKTIGLDRTNTYITNILPWRPPGNRTPTAGEIAVCLPFVKRQVDIMEPEVIVMLGGSAANAMLGNSEPISKLRGKWVDYKLSSGKSCRVLATFHPAFLLRNSGQKAKAWADLQRVAKEDI